eukprot:gene721-770_t
MNVEEIKAAIVVKGDQIRDLKVAKPPTLKEDLAPLVNELLALKIQYKEATGEDYGAGAPKEEKKKKEPEGEPNKGQAEKNRKKEERIAKRAEAKAQEETKATTAAAEDPLADRYGDAPLVQSGVITKRVFYNIGDLKENLIGQKVWIRARLATSRAVSKGVFILLRQTTNTVQGVVWQGSQVSKAMVKYAAGISLESIVDIEAEIIKAETPVQSATVKELELSIVEIHVVSRAQDLPFQVEDAGRNETFAQENSLPTVKQDTALDFRWVDTRTPANQAIFRIQSGVCQLFREYFNSRGFVEIHTPKLIGGASEGGANVFKLSYFDQPACLAQSPQFYKQMTAACGGFERVYEIGPVFRAENSNTHRHLCEFTGLDFEMAIYEHYYEVLEVMGELFNFIFDGINERYQHELVLISQQYPFEPIKYLRPPLRITFQEGITLLREAGIDASFEEDISTPHEKALGKIVKEKFGTDFYMMDKYPLSVRPFYTMPDPNDPKLSNSYDLFIRGEEIVSGAQRVHDPELLIKRAEHFNIPIKSIQSYVDAFKHGALPHGGGGIGLERVVMLFLGLSNIRKTSMFPRDPNRLAP